MTDTYASYTRNTSESIKALAHSRRFQQAAAIISARPDDRVLDFGCADGHLFAHLPKPEPLTLSGGRVGYDPDPALLAQCDRSLDFVEYFSDPKQLLERYRGSFSVVVCMEVCEHLTPKALDEALATLVALAAPNARVVIGVPIETGTSGFAKQLYRLTKGGRMGASWDKAFKSLLGIPIERRVTDVEWYGDHTGFNDRELARTLHGYGLAVESKAYLPFRWLGRVLNNECYYSCRRT